MAKLTFVHGTMTSGKTTALLQEAHNLELFGYRPYLLTAAKDTRSGFGQIKSRIGISARAHTFESRENLFLKIQKAHAERQIRTILCDEAQFLTRDQVWELSDVVDDLGIDVRCFGLKSDFRGQLFEGSSTLLSLATDLVENTGICPTGDKASMVLRLDGNGDPILDGPQVMVGGEETYVAVSRREWKRRVRDFEAKHRAMSA